MALALNPVTTTTFPQEWNAGIEPGETYRFDPMHFPFALSPLTLSAIGRAFGPGATAGFRSLRLPIAEIRTVIRNHYRYENWVQAEPRNEVEAREFAETAEASMQVEVGRLMERWENEHLPRVLQHLERLQAMDVEGATVSMLHALLDEADAIHEDLWNIHFQVAPPMLLAMQLFDEFYADVVGGSETDGHALLVGNPSQSVKAGIGLSDLAHDARVLGVADTILDGDMETLVDELEQTGSGIAFLARLDFYLKEFGLRQDLFELATPTWLEDPSIALASVRNYLRSGHDAEREHERRAAAAARELVRVRQRLAAYPEAVRNHFETMVLAGRAGAFLQEEHNFYIDQRGLASLRLFYLRVGQRLVDAGLLNRADDVVMFTIDEIHDALVLLRSPHATDRLRAFVAVREQELAIARKMTPPPFIGDAPAGPPTGENPMERATMRFFGGPPEQAADPNQVKGNGGSKGVVTGIARVAPTLEEATALQPGEVLVAITTMPAWTPLFGIAAAVVTETGGALSHCAIVAREYGIPAVVGAYGATQRIRTGQRVTVDGTSGLVTLEA